MTPCLIQSWLTKDGLNPFSGKTDTGLKATDGKAAFLTLAALVVSCKAAYAAYLAAKADASQGGVQNTAIRNARRAELVVLLRTLLSNINGICQGDVEMLLSSGFPMCKTTPTPVGPLPAPQPPVLRRGPVSGTITAASTSVYGGALYTIELTLASAAGTVLQTKQGTGARFGFDGLTPGAVYNVRMMVNGSAGPSDWSDVSTIRIV
jgi:hypothetical protein